MVLSEQDEVLLRPHILKQVEVVSDADAQALTDYIVALLKNNDDPPQLQRRLEEELADFVEDSKAFSTSLIDALNSRSFDPNSNNNSHAGESRHLQGTASQQHKRNIHNLVSYEEIKGSGSLIVTNVPPEKLSEDLLREHFSKFGELNKITIDSMLRIVELEYSNPEAAKAAWTSTEPIFDNRFIKIFYKKTAPPLNIEEIKARQLVKQQEFEAKMAIKKQRDDKLKQVIKIKEKILLDIESQLDQLEQELRNDQSKQDEISIKVAQLKQQMIDNDVSPESIQRDYAKLSSTALPVTRGRGRGFSRGSFPRCRGFPRGRSRGRGRGRGGFTPYSRPNMKLDLRTKTITIKNFNNPKDQSFERAIGGFSDKISSIFPKDQNNLNVEFTDRFFAEKFFRSNIEVANVGVLQKEWDESTGATPTPTVNADQEMA